MRTMIFLLAALTASMAHADVSDSGNLSIGGNGVISGTMTVQGSAFSVGGTTFSVAGGSATFGGIINAAAAGIKWADGSTSTTASSGNSSGVFTSSVTVGPQVYSSTIDAGGVIVNGWTKVAASSFTAASAVYFYGFQSSTTYRVHFQFYDATTSQTRLNVSGLTSGHHASANCLGSAGTKTNGTTTNLGYWIIDDGSTNLWGNSTGYSMDGAIEIESQPDTGSPRFHGTDSYPNASGNDSATGCLIQGHIVGVVSAPYWLKFFPSAGNYTGRIWIEQMTLKETY